MANPYDLAAKAQRDLAGVLRIAGFGRPVSLRPMPAELLAVAKKDVDAAAFAEFADGVGTPVLAEFATFPNDREPEQMLRSVAIYYAATRQVPEALMVVLCPKGRKTLPSEHRETSPLGAAALAVQYRRVNLWEVSARAMLALDDPSVLPWVPLMDFEGADPAAVLAACRQGIDRLPQDRREEALAMAWTFAHLAFDDQALLELLRTKPMEIDWLEAPGVKAFMQDQMAKTVAETVAEESSKLIAKGKAEGAAEGMRRGARVALRRRFGAVGREAEALLAATTDAEELSALLERAIFCATPEEFLAGP